MHIQDEKRAQVVADKKGRPNNIGHPGFESASAALRTLGQDFNDWCSILTTNSIQAAYAIIAANWAVHGSKNAILENAFAKYSIATILLFLGINLVATKLMVYLYYRQYRHAETDPGNWENEFKKSRGTNTAWPWTKTIETLGTLLRCLKTIFPVIGTILFLLSLFN